MKTTRKQSGFTIVELLIVVVVIGILAAIVIVAYNGVTNRARSSKSAATAGSITKKVEAFNSEKSAYPANYTDLTGAATTTSYYIPAASYSLKATTDVASTDNESTFNYAVCTTPPATGAGYRIQVWDYANNAIATTYGGGATSGSTCTNVAS